MTNKKRAALRSLGCKVNSYETEAIRERLEAAGFEIVAFEDENADVYVINTCTVTNIADRKSRQMLHRAKKKNPKALVVALGCYVQTGADKVKEDDAIDLAIGNNKKGDIVNLILAALDEKDKCSKDEIDLDISKEYENLAVDRASEHTRSYIKIQDGCDQFCSYCAIPLARGRVRSRQVVDILDEANRLVDSGIKELVLTGIHLCSYGLDFFRKDNDLTRAEAEKDYLADSKESFYKAGYLIDVIEKMARIPGLERIRLGSLEPRMITEEFAGRLKATGKVCPHFHLSLQSGCDSVLARMNRHYDIREYADKVNILRNVFHNPAITTDVIVGFPGETKEEFELSFDFLEKINFYEIHVFQYSPRKGTVASRMKPQVSPEEKKKRSDRVLDLTSRQKKAFEELYRGKRVSVLVEEIVKSDKGCLAIGHTPEYIRVEMENGESYKVNTIVEYPF